MKRNTLIAAATAGVVALSIAVGSVAMAASGSAETEAAELQQFLAENPSLNQAVADIEAKTGGKVTEAEFEDDDGPNLVEFEVAMPDGTSQEMILNTADGSMSIEVDDDDETENN